MIQLLFVFCQIANAQACETRPSGIDILSMHECTVLGPMVAARDPFLQEHPDYMLSKIICMDAKRQTQL